MRFQTCPVKRANEANCRRCRLSQLSGTQLFHCTFLMCNQQQRFHLYGLEFIYRLLLVLCFINLLDKDRISKPEQSSERKSKFDSWSCGHRARNRRLPSPSFTHGHITSLSSTYTPGVQMPLSHHSPGFAQSMTGYCQTQTQHSKAVGIMCGAVLCKSNINKSSQCTP